MSIPFVEYVVVNPLGEDWEYEMPVRPTADQLTNLYRHCDLLDGDYLRVCRMLLLGLVYET